MKYEGKTYFALIFNIMKKIVTLLILLGTLSTVACAVDTNASTESKASHDVQTKSEASRDVSTNSATKHHAQEVLQSNQGSSERLNLDGQLSEVDINSSIQKSELLEVVYEQQKIIQKLLETTVVESAEPSNSSEISYADMSAILLAAVAVIVTVLGVVVAILSLWGFRNIKASSIDAATTVSNEIATKVAEREVGKSINEVAKKEIARLIDEGKLTKHLESAVDVILRRGAAEGASGFNNYPELDEEVGDA